MSTLIWISHLITVESNHLHADIGWIEVFASCMHAAMLGAMVASLFDLPTADAVTGESGLHRFVRIDLLLADSAKWRLRCNSHYIVEGEILNQLCLVLHVFLVLCHRALRHVVVEHHLWLCCSRWLRLHSKRWIVPAVAVGGLDSLQVLRLWRLRLVLAIEALSCQLPIISQLILA